MDPPTRAARAGAPKRVRGWVPNGREKWSATCPGVPRVGPAGCRPSGGSFGDVVLASVLVWANTYNTYKYKIGYTHDTYKTYRYQHIHTHTYTYIHQAIRVERGFCEAVAAARDASAQRYLPRSSPTGLRACSPSAKCVWNAYWLSRGCTLDPPTRAARAGAPKRVRGGSPMAGKSGRPPAQGCPEWGQRGAAPAGGLLGTLCWHPCLSGPIYTIHTAYMRIHTMHAIHAHMD